MRTSTSMLILLITAIRELVICSASKAIGFRLYTISNYIQPCAQCCLKKDMAKYLKSKRVSNEESRASQSGM
jgi:hypothetical protein